jgi:hypothetical protein
MIYALKVLEIKWINNLDIQLKGQVTCIGYNFTIPDYTMWLKNVSQM